MFGFLKKLFTPAYETLSGNAFKEKFQQLGKDGVLLDVRTAMEHKSDSIKGSKNIDIIGAQFGEKVAQLDPAKTYFVYCRSGARSARACSIMSDKGLKVYNLSGGIGSWKK
jgi:rhodanese-related sulfurtransferase